ncbi:MAG: SRPBCC domain-containing protein, partial [Gammaproteobacteria bacterium]
MNLELDKGTQSPPQEIVITRIFDAPRALVFKAWTEPAHLARWWGPVGFTTRVCEMDSRPGGGYRFQMRSPEGIESWWYGACREIVEPERIVWSCTIEGADGKRISSETLLTVTLEEQQGRTKLTLHQAIFDSAAIREAHK